MARGRRCHFGGLYHVFRCSGDYMMRNMFKFSSSMPSNKESCSRQIKDKDCFRYFSVFPGFVSPTAFAFVFCSCFCWACFTSTPKKKQKGQGTKHQSQRDGEDETVTKGGNRKGIPLTIYRDFFAVVFGLHWFRVSLGRRCLCCKDKKPTPKKPERNPKTTAKKSL